MRLRRLISTGLALWFGLPLAGARALSLSQLETQTRVLLRDTSADVAYQRFSNSTIDSFLNEGHRQMQNDSWLYQGSIALNLVAGQQEYALPADYITTVRVTISSVPLTQVSFQGLDANYTNWTVVQSTPTQYFIDSFVTGAPDNIGFYPTPKINSTGSVFVQYVRQVPSLVNPTDIPFAGNSELLPYNDALADFAASRCWTLLGRNDLAGPMMAMYTSRASQARANLNKQPNFQPGMQGDRGPRQ